MTKFFSIENGEIYKKKLNQQQIIKYFWRTHSTLTVVHVTAHQMFVLLLVFFFLHRSRHSRRQAHTTHKKNSNPTKTTPKLTVPPFKHELLKATEGDSSLPGKSRGRLRGRGWWRRGRWRGWWPTWSASTGCTWASYRARRTTGRMSPGVWEETGSCEIVHESVCGVKYPQLEPSHSQAKVET